MEAKYRGSLGASMSGVCAGAVGGVASADVAGAASPNEGDLRTEAPINPEDLPFLCSRAEDLPKTCEEPENKSVGEVEPRMTDEAEAEGV
jgi:hypothetical protein